MAEKFRYNPLLGLTYAQSFALYDNVPEDERLFYYAVDKNCTNFISQCVWAAYGGWIPGYTANVVAENAKRILGDVRQVSAVWYGSKSNIGSNKWCRVEEFYSYVTDQNKRVGPMAKEIGRGTFETLDPSILMPGDVIQMIVASYDPSRFGHGLYVTRSGASWDDTLICCNSDDRLNESMSWFEQFPDIYKELRILRFSDAYFKN